MKPLTWTLFVLGMILNAALWWASQVKAQEGWQLRRLHEPSDRELLSERQGSIVTYDGLKDTQVEKAMDEEYDRIQSMMFIRTVVTDNEGEPLRDAQTGELMVEEDDCD